MATNFSVSVGIQWTPPSAAANSGNSTISVLGTNNVPISGAVDIPGATPQGTAFALPFGSLGAPKLFAIKNMMTSDIGIRLNGAVADNFKLAPGGFLMLAQPAASADEPIASCSIVTTAVPVALETVQFWLFGD